MRSKTLVIYDKITGVVLNTTKAKRINKTKDAELCALHDGCAEEHGKLLVDEYIDTPPGSNAYVVDGAVVYKYKEEVLRYTEARINPFRAPMLDDIDDLSKQDLLEVVKYLLWDKLKNRGIIRGDTNPNTEQYKQVMRELEELNK